METATHRRWFRTGDAARPAGRASGPPRLRAPSAAAGRACGCGARTSARSGRMRRRPRRVATGRRPDRRVRPAGAGSRADRRGIAPSARAKAGTHATTTSAMAAAIVRRARRPSPSALKGSPSDRTPAGHGCATERRNRRSLRISTPVAACAGPGGSRTFSMHRARSSLSPPPRVQRPALRGLRGTRGASRRRPPARCLVFRGETDISYHPTAETGSHEPFRVTSGTPDRFVEVDLLADCTTTMRDGVVLGSDVYVPRGAGPVPAIAIRHPYGRRTPEMGMAELGSFFARKGYACVVQDVRGKFSSGGVFDPASARSRTATTPSTGSRTPMVQRPRRPVGRVVLRVHVAGRRDQRPPGRGRHRARRHRHRLAGGLVPRRRAAAQHRRLLGDRDGRPGVRRPDPRRSVVPAAGGDGRGGRRPRRLLPGHDRPRRATTPGGASAACATGWPTSACPC